VFVDKPKVSQKVGSLLFTAVTGFMFSMAVVSGPSAGVFFWGPTGLFALGCLLTTREFLYRPVRITTIDPAKSELVVEETAPLRRRRIVAQIPRGACFETYACDADGTPYFGVRVKAEHGGWIVVGDYLLRHKAEALAVEATHALRT
jgi:hypothetical protein